MELAGVFYLEGTCEKGRFSRLIFLHSSRKWWGAAGLRKRCESALFRVWGLWRIMEYQYTNCTSTIPFEYSSEFMFHFSKEVIKTTSKHLTTCKKSDIKLAH